MLSLAVIAVAIIALSLSAVRRRLFAEHYAAIGDGEHVLTRAPCPTASFAAAAAAAGSARDRLLAAAARQGARYPSVVPA